ncbi:hypothetical protein ACPPVO_43175 [Dactylosporangium sp. McL0621]|uniref:hypothetical protein n=1 Tax=Dactylosporangium sp. McL0621 TaxID=3415678 RepID=UPI003CF0CAA8
MTQIYTIIAVAVGALLSYLASIHQGRLLFRRDTMYRWSQRTFDACVEYMLAVEDMAGGIRDLTLGNLDHASQQSAERRMHEGDHLRSKATEVVRLIGSPALVQAAFVLNRSLERLRDFVGERWVDDQWEAAYLLFVDAFANFQVAVRQELRVPGVVPVPPRPPRYHFERRPGNSEPLDAGHIETSPSGGPDIVCQ